MFISHKYRVVFIHIQRTGGTSISRVFREFDDKLQYQLALDPALKQPKHPLARNVRAAMGPGLFDDYVKFAVVRNPFDRMVSWYAIMAKDTVENFAPHLTRDDGGFGGEVLRAVQRQARSFDGFIALPKEDAEGLFERFHTPQFDYLSDDRGRLIIDHVLRFENLSEDFNALAREIGFEGRLPHHNRSIRQESYRDYYDPSTREEVARRFKRDIDHFGYRF